MLERGDIVGKWTVAQVLRKSTTGTAYLCEPLSPGATPAVIKVFDFQSLDRGKERFERFAKMLARLNHPGVPRYIGFVADPPSVACDWRQGTFLDKRLAVRPLSQRDVLDLARGLAATLAYLHSEDIIHRAVKSETVFLPDDGQAQLMDFGVALESEEERLTQAGSVVGTLRILPPEAFESGNEDGTWDLYALGILLYEALLGREAFCDPDGTPATTTKLLRRKLQTPHLDPGEGVHEALRTVIRAMTSRDLTARPATGGEVVQALADVRIKSDVPPPASALLANLKASAEKRRQAEQAPAPAPQTTVPQAPHTTVPQAAPAAAPTPEAPTPAAPEAPPSPSRLPLILVAVALLVVVLGVLTLL